MHTDTALPADEACPALSDAAAFKRFFEHEGYVLVRNALPPAACAEAVEGFLKEVHLDTRALFLRQPPARHEAHVYTLAGHMQYPILHLQDLPGRRYPQFKSAGLALLTDAVLRRAVETLLGEPARLVESMFFDGNPATAPHRDVPFVDATGSATMIGAWIAAEDIDAGAGRFFVLPRSHWRPVPGEHGHQRGSTLYRAAMAVFVAQGAGARMAPSMRQGDLLLWNAMTVHGSLPATKAASARRAFTGHYTGRSARLEGGAKSASITPDGMEILHYSDSRSLANLLRADYPGAYALLRRLRQLPPWARRRQTAAGCRPPS